MARILVMIDHAMFRDIALSLPGAIEKPHFNRTSFRVDGKGGKIFATMGPDAKDANLMLLRDEQEMLMGAEPETFTRIPNKWGENGCTTMHFAFVDHDTAKSALMIAWRNAAPKKLLAEWQS